MVRIRLRRIGLKGQPTYRIIAADKEAPRDGRFLEILGVYNPRTNPATIHIKEDRVFHWMKNGALPTESVAQIFKTSGTQERFERLKKGEAFDVVAKEVSEDSSAAQGGDLGWFGKGQMVKEFEDVSFKLDVNQISDIVTVSYTHLTLPTKRIV